MSDHPQPLVIPSRLGQWQVRTVDIPKPGKDELLVKVEAAALNPFDWKAQAYSLIETYPAQPVLGFDATGWVQALGEGVTSFTVGDRV